MTATKKCQIPLLCECHLEAEKSVKAPREQTLATSPTVRDGGYDNGLPSAPSELEEEKPRGTSKEKAKRPTSNTFVQGKSKTTM